MNTNFQGKTVPKENASYKCLSFIIIDPVIKVNKMYYPQTLLEDCKYKIKKNKIENLINDDVESDDESDSDESNGMINLLRIEECVLIISWIS